MVIVARLKIDVRVHGIEAMRRRRFQAESASLRRSYERTQPALTATILASAVADLDGDRFGTMRKGKLRRAQAHIDVSDAIALLGEELRTPPGEVDLKAARRGEDTQGSVHGFVPGQCLFGARETLVDVDVGHLRQAVCYRKLFWADSGEPDVVGQDGRDCSK